MRDTNYLGVLSTFPILGYKIIVVTDHFNLTNILTTAVKNVKMLRMGIIISEFAPDLVFKCGKENIAADYMSRFLSFSSNEDDLVNIMQMQVSEQVEFNIGGHVEKRVAKELGVFYS